MVRAVERSGSQRTDHKIELNRKGLLSAVGWRGVRTGLTEKVTFEQRPEGGEGGSPTPI